MSWLCLFIAGLCEIGWPIGLKLANGKHTILWALVAVGAMAASGFFLYLAQKVIPMGTAYGVWTGIGAVGAFIVGVYWFKDPLTTFRVVSMLLIVAGIIGLKLSSH